MTHFHILLSTTFPWQSLVKQAQYCEALGFESVFLPGVDTFAEETLVQGLDSWIILSVIAMHTNLIRLGILGVHEIDQDPLLARRADTVDRICGGRLLLAAPVGKGGSLKCSGPAQGRVPDEGLANLYRWEQMGGNPKQGRRMLVFGRLCESLMVDPARLVEVLARYKDGGITDFCLPYLSAQVGEGDLSNTVNGDFLECMADALVEI